MHMTDEKIKSVTSRALNLDKEKKNTLIEIHGCKQAIPQRQAPNGQ